ncbi:hypothetical protein IAU59_000856 [Kwoniella sp. CBS 9459]
MSTPSEHTLSAEGQTRSIHPGFEEGDVTFLSTDGVGFRVSGKRLAAVSDVFKAMLELPPTNGANGTDDMKPPFKIHRTEPIHIEIDKVKLEAFLAMLVSPIPMLPLTSFENTCEIYKLCYKYDRADRITEMARIRLTERGKGIANILHLAATPEYEDWHLGRLALEQADSKEVLDLLLNEQEMRRFPSTWALCLFRTYFRGPTRGNFVSFDGTVVWEGAVALKFEGDRPPLHVFESRSW